VIVTQSGIKMENIIEQLGRKLKKTRTEKNLKLHEVAAKALISKGLLSKVENGRTIPSLSVLISIVHALGEEMTNFFNGMYAANDKPFIVLKKADYNLFEKEEANGFQYRHVLTRSFSTLTVETVILTLGPLAKRQPVTTDAFEYKYIIKGSAEYKIGDEVVVLEEGDSLYFDGRISHSPSNPSEEPCTLLVVYFFFNDVLTS